MFKTTIAGSLPKPGWLAETNKLWPAWRAQGPELERAKRDATLLWLKEQEAAGLDIVGDGEQSRQHFATTATTRWCRRWSRRCASRAACIRRKRAC
jgi:methionine synthase II (cobalamin-independent)